MTPPYLVYKKLDELFPDLTIEYSYFNDALDNYMTLDKEIIKNPFEVNLYAVKEPKKFLMWNLKGVNWQNKGMSRWSISQECVYGPTSPTEIQIRRRTSTSFATRIARQS